MKYKCSISPSFFYIHKGGFNTEAFAELANLIDEL